MHQFNDLYQPNVVKTYSGLLFNIKDPVPEKVFPVDIAFGLARECRFQGGCRKFYSVAEHSVWVARQAADRYPQFPYLPFKALMHDAHEAYIKDIPSPLKSLFHKEYNAIAEPVQAAIHTRYSIVISEAERTAIYELDQLALEWEWTNKVKQWTGICLSDDKSRAGYFLEYFKELCRVPVVMQPGTASIV